MVNNNRLRKHNKTEEKRNNNRKVSLTGWIESEEFDRLLMWVKFTFQHNFTGCK